MNEKIAGYNVAEDFEFFIIRQIKQVKEEASA